MMRCAEWKYTESYPFYKQFLELIGGLLFEMCDFCLRNSRTSKNESAENLKEAKRDSMQFAVP